MTGPCMHTHMGGEDPQVCRAIVTEVVRSLPKRTLSDPRASCVGVLVVHRWRRDDDSLQSGKRTKRFGMDDETMTRTPCVQGGLHM